jgi:hypothetical protein
VGRFDGKVTGSSKCDAYLWALEEFVRTGKCNKAQMAYFIDYFWVDHHSDDYTLNTVGACPSLSWDTQSSIIPVWCVPFSAELRHPSSITSGFDHHSDDYTLNTVGACSFSQVGTNSSLPSSPILQLCTLFRPVKTTSSVWDDEITIGLITRFYIIETDSPCRRQPY